MSCSRSLGRVRALVVGAQQVLISSVCGPVQGGTLSGRMENALGVSKPVYSIKKPNPRRRAGGKPTKDRLSHFPPGSQLVQRGEVVSQIDLKPADSKQGLRARGQSTAQSEYAQYFRPWLSGPTPHIDSHGLTFGAALCAQSDAEPLPSRPDTAASLPAVLGGSGAFISPWQPNGKAANGVGSLCLAAVNALSKSNELSQLQSQVAHLLGSWGRVTRAFLHHLARFVFDSYFITS
jgi:hypothetical protein